MKAAWLTCLSLVLLLATADCGWGQVSLTSTIADQKQVAVTAYNSNLALIRDTRRLDLPAGTVDLRLTDVAAKVRPATVHIGSATAGGLTVLEQTYRYDLLDPAKLLERYVGRTVTLVRLRTVNNSTEEVDVKAVLLANNGAEPVWKVGNTIVTGMSADRYVFPALPKNLYSKPTLVWLLQSSSAGPQTLEVSYLTEGMGWDADYVLNVDAGERRGEITGWASIVNNSGASFENADLQLVAGEVHRAAPRMAQGAVPPPMVAPEMLRTTLAQEPVSGYHLYTLNRPATLANDETKQISLIETSRVGIERHFVVNGKFFEYEPVIPSRPLKDSVEVHLKFKNSRANSLGLPLPAGTVRVYQTDSKGREQFIGEDRINHTAKGETVDLWTGDAFDIVEERKQTDYAKLGPHETEMAFEITLRNHMPSPVTVEVNEPIPGEWAMLQSNFKYQKTAAFAARFMVPVEAGGQSVLKYRVRTRQ